jgi:hypothetical protein
MGKHKTIETPEQMWELFEAYKKTVAKNPILIQDYVGKDGQMVYRERQRPLTMEGFENYCEDNICYVHQYFVNQEQRYGDYVNICSRIRRTIRQDQIEGGMASIYNPSITQRLNNLTEKTDVTSNGKELNEIKITIVGGDSSNENI